MPPGPRVFRFTPRLLAWLMLDLVGMGLFVAGALYLANGRTLLWRVPTTLIEAAILLVAGGVLMLMAAANLLRPVLPGSSGRSTEKLPEE